MEFRVEGLADPEPPQSEPEKTSQRVGYDLWSKLAAKSKFTSAKQKIVFNECAVGLKYLSLEEVIHVGTECLVTL